MKLKELISTRCLRGVETLTLETVIGKTSTEVAPIMETITKLQSLQHLEVTNLGLDIKTISEFRLLVNLKSVIWRTHWVFEDDEMNEQSGRTLYQQTIAEGAFDTAFVCFDEKPRVTIDLSGRISAAYFRMR
jgi:hypothetical protein